MFAEPKPSKQTHLPVKPTTKPFLVLSKRGSFFKVAGGGLLAASFLLPATYLGEQAFYPYSSFIIQETWLRFLFPIVYLFGVSSFVVGLAANVGGHGLPRPLFWMHVLTVTAIAIGSGTSIFLGLISPQKGFGVAMLGPVLLLWFPLIAQFILTWFSSKKPLVWKLARTSWIGATFSLLVLSLAVLECWFIGPRSANIGLYAALGGALALLFGNFKTEAECNPD